MGRTFHSIGFSLVAGLSHDATLNISMASRSCRSTMISRRKPFDAFQEKFRHGLSERARDDRVPIWSNTRSDGTRSNEPKEFFAGIPADRLTRVDDIAPLLDGEQLSFKTSSFRRSCDRDDPPADDRDIAGPTKSTASSPRPPTKLSVRCSLTSPAPTAARSGRRAPSL
jgi:hypothetical protein